MFRKRADQLEVLLAHPGGPLYRNKDDGVWTIPKGEIDHAGDDLLRRAQMEFEEEVGIPAEGGDWIDLGWVKQKGGKTVYAWAFEGDLPGRFQCRSNLFEMEWPPRSGKMQNFPEVDQACFFSLKDARRKLKEAQTPFLDRLVERLEARSRER
jgi:predicted NUDIX family NTP pyrophosphohydrolase